MITVSPQRHEIHVSATDLGFVPTKGYIATINENNIGIVPRQKEGGLVFTLIELESGYGIISLPLTDPDYLEFLENQDFAKVTEKKLNRLGSELVELIISALECDTEELERAPEPVAILS